MKHIYLMRHGAQQPTDNPVGGPWDVKAPLSDKGIDDVAETTRRHLMAAPISLIVTSPILRAEQTAYLARQVLGKPEALRILLSPALGPGPTESWAWMEELTRIIPDPTPREMLAYAPPFMQARAEQVAMAITLVLATIYHGEAALLVSHQPLVEAGVAAMTGQWSANLAAHKGGIFRLEYEHDTEPPTVTYLPPPA